MQMITQDNIQEIKEGRRVNITPSIFAEAAYLIEGQPFRFAAYGKHDEFLGERKYLKTIYDTDIIEGMIKSGRQVEKSTTLSIKIGNGVLLKPFSRSLFVAPQNEQVKTFSKTRLGKLFRYSQGNIVRKYYMSTQLTDQVYMKEFANGSEVYLRHCFEEGDNIRGLSIDDLFLDEIQDIMVDAIPVIKETQSHSKNPTTWYTGTPKTFSNTIEQLWQTSTKGEWIVRCSRCGCYQILGIPNMTPTEMICRKCKQPMRREDITDGFWKEMEPNKLLKGFRISQLMVPWIKMDGNNGLWQKFENYSPAKFHNEVLGLSYENADKPFNDTLLYQISNNDLTFMDSIPPDWALTETYMGVDWGTGEKSYTVVVIFGVNPHNGKFQLMKAKRYQTAKELEVDYQVRDIAAMMQQYRIKTAVVDWGFGYVQIQRLRQAFGNRIMPCYYSHSKKEKISWDASKQHYVVRRTDVLQDYVQFVHNMGVVWPGAIPSDIQFLKEHHLAVQTEYRPGSNGRSEEMIYTHPITMPDDGFHACNYAYMAYRLFRGDNNLYRTNYGGNQVEFVTVQSR